MRGGGVLRAGYPKDSLTLRPPAFLSTLPNPNLTPLPPYPNPPLPYPNHSLTLPPPAFLSEVSKYPPVSS